MQSTDKYNFSFWLRWISGFILSLTAVALLVTWSMEQVFGSIDGAELVVTWVVSVFGAWFLIVAPFMRKKEQIWKRLNDDQESAVDAWLTGMAVLIGALVAACFGFSIYYHVQHQLHVHRGFEWAWVKSVLVTWLVILVPVLFWMYRKAEVLMRVAIARQSKDGSVFKRGFIPKPERRLRDDVISYLKKMPETLPGGQVIQATLFNGETIPHVYIKNATELLGVYDVDSVSFKGQDIVKAFVYRSEDLPAYDETKWMRLDG